MASNPFDQFDAPARSYDTQLDPAQEKSYRTWMNRIGHTKAAGYRIDDNFSGQDYDYRGFFKKNGPTSIAQGQHFPDEFKKPAHETFSNESRYAVGADETKAGSWDGETFLPAQGRNPFDQFDAAPTQKSGLFDRVKGYGSDYLQGLKQAGDALMEPSDDVPGVGALEAVGTMATGLVSPLPAAIESAVLGTPYREARDKFVYQPQTQSGQAMVGGLGALTKPVGDALGFAAGKAGDALDYIPGVSSEGAQESGAALVDALGLATAARTPAPGTRAAPKKPAEIPTTEALKDAKNKAYAAAKEVDVTVPAESYSKALGTVRNMVKEEGLDPTLHPKSTAVMARLDGAEGKPLTLQDAETLRKIALDAEDDMNPVTRAPTPDARIAGKIVDELDEQIDALDVNSPARALNARFRRSDMVDRMIRRAEIKAGAHYTQAGMEHALRQEFKQLALNDRRMRFFTKEQRDAIEKVAKGGPVENALRNLGKFDPTSGGMATLVGLGSGALAAGFDNPLSLALPAGGFIGRRAATQLTRKNVEAAREALVGRGPPTAGQSNVPASAAGTSSIPPALLLSAMLGQRRP